MAGFKGFSYDEYVKPLDSVQKAHNEVITDMASLSQNSEILDYYLDPNRDKESYNLYNKFKSELNFNVDDFAKNGLTRNNGMNLLNLHRNYNNNVANVLDAVKNREADRAQQQKIQEQSKGQAIFGLNGTDGDANGRSVDFYLQGNKGFAHQNLDEVRDEAMKFAAAASKRKYYNSLDAKEQAERDMKAFAGMYYREKERIGYDDKASYNIIKKLMSQYENALGMNIEEIPDEHPDGFLKNMKRMLQEREIDQFNERDRGRMIDAYINGIDEGLTYVAKDELKDTPEMRKAGRNVQNVNVGGNDFVNPDKSRSVHDENVADSTFENKNRKLQEKTTQTLLGQNDDVSFRGMTMTVNVDGQTLHRLANFREYLNNIGAIYNNKGYYTYPNGTVGTDGLIIQTINGKKVKVPKGLYNDYLNKIKNITSTYYLNEGDGSTAFNADIKTMMAPKTKTEYLEFALPRYIDINERDANGHKYISTQMRINQSDKKAAVGNALARLGNQTLKMQPKYNPKTRTWSWGKQDDGGVAQMLAKADLNNGCDISLVYMPQSKNDQHPLWVQVKTNEIYNGKKLSSVFIPLASFTSSDDDKLATELNNLAENRRDIIDRNIDILGIDKNVSIGKIKNLISEYKKINDKDERDAKLDSAYQIMESIEYLDYYIHKRNLVADDGNQANRTIKQVIDDLNEAEAK